ncbi:MAG: ABC transporter ATP-binding protein, partial [Fervidobacterium sp.]
NFYTYDGIVKALDGVNLKIKKGEVLGLVGETGCGKSVTSLSTLAMVITPGMIEEGKINFNLGKKTLDILDLRESDLLKIRGHFISMIFQEPRAALNPVYTVADQISEVYFQHRKEELIKASLSELENEIKEASGLKRLTIKYEISQYKKMLTNPKSLTLRLLLKIPILNRFQNRMKKIARKEIIELLKILRIPDPSRVVDMYPHELSGGMAQRVVIAMALACNPLLLVADEPTTNLDVTVQAQILQQIKELKEKFGSSILYVTHDLGVVAEICDRVAVMYGGNVIEVADVMSLFEKPLHPYTQGLLESIPRPGKKFTSIPGTVPSLINPPPGCRFHDRCKYAMEICPKIKPKLVEVEKEHEVACHLYYHEH